jgi:hypothetical protein
VVLLVIGTALAVGGLIAIFENWLPEQKGHLKMCETIDVWLATVMLCIYGIDAIVTVSSIVLLSCVNTVTTTRHKLWGKKTSVNAEEPKNE